MPATDKAALLLNPASVNLPRSFNGGAIQTSNDTGTARTVIDGFGTRMYDGNGVLRIDEDPLTQLIQAFDNFGTGRAQMGNLPQIGISGPLWGFRALSAAGTPVFDSDGLIAAASFISWGGISNQNMTLAAYTDVPFSSGTAGTGPGTFSCSRQTNFLATAMFYGKTSGAVGNFAFLDLRIGSANQVGNWGGAPQILDKSNGGFVNGGLAFEVSLPAGSYSYALRVGVDAGQTANVFIGFVFLLQLGG